MSLFGIAKECRKGIRTLQLYLCRYDRRFPIKMSVCGVKNLSELYTPEE